MKPIILAVFFCVTLLNAKSQIVGVFKPDTLMQRLPVFPGGYNKLAEYIHSNLKYPETALKNHVQGTVYMRFYVEVDGSITNIKVEDSLSTETNAEALRLVKGFPKWIPAIYAGHPIRFGCLQPIVFKLN